MPITTRLKHLPADGGYNKAALLVGRDSVAEEYELVDVDTSGQMAVRNMIWNTDTLAWEKATGSLGAGGAVEITNWPTTQQVRQMNSLVTENYDEIALGYDGTQLSTVTFKLASATVATLTLSYSGTTLTGVVKT